MVQTEGAGAIFCVTDMIINMYKNGFTGEPVQLFCCRVIDLVLRHSFAVFVKDTLD